MIHHASYYTSIFIRDIGQVDKIVCVCVCVYDDITSQSIFYSNLSSTHIKCAVLIRK